MSNKTFHDLQKYLRSETHSCYNNINNSYDNDIIVWYPIDDIVMLYENRIIVYFCTNIMTVEDIHDMYERISYDKDGGHPLDKIEIFQKIEW